MEEPVLTEVARGVGRITLNRPSAYNAITIELSRALEAAVRELAATARVIVITGAGQHFCVGGDFKQMEALRAEGREATRELFTAFHAACDAIAAAPVPVISAVHGFAVAGGFELALASDIVLVAEDARLADIHSNHGMVPGGGSTQRLARLVGQQRALGLIITGERLSGAEAVDWGIAYASFAIDEFPTGVSEFAERIAAKDPDALAASKRLVRAGLELSLAEGIALELETVLDHLDRPVAFAKESK